MSSSSSNRSKFEDLSDDILMDIFDLLSPPVYIYHSFYNLNQRLNKIISDSRLLVSLDLSHLINPSNFAYHCQIMLPHMSKQLISLRLSNEQKFYEQIKIFLSHIRLGNFHALRQLSLIQVTFDQLRRMLADILSLNMLNRLDIDMFGGSDITRNELNLIVNALLSESNALKTNGQICSKKVDNSHMVGMTFKQSTFIISCTMKEAVFSINVEQHGGTKFPRQTNMDSVLHELVDQNLDAVEKFFNPNGRDNTSTDLQTITAASALPTTTTNGNQYPITTTSMATNYDNNTNTNNSNVFADNGNNIEYDPDDLFEDIN